MKIYKAPLQSLLHDLKSKPHCIHETKAVELVAKVQEYLNTDDTEDVLPDAKIDNEVITFKPVGSVAVIDINGVILKRTGYSEAFLSYFDLVDLDHVDTKLNKALADETITAIVLNVTSPGGFLSGVQSTAKLIDTISKTKAVIVFSDVLNASAAYWLSSQASSIITTLDAEVGSIGVYTTVDDYSEALDSMGVKIHLIKAGKWKALGNPSQPLSDEQKAFLQEEINQTWTLFKEAVNAKRTVAEDDMQGQTFSGQALFDKGLVDGFAADISEVISILTTKEESVNT